MKVFRHGQKIPGQAALACVLFLLGLTATARAQEYGFDVWTTENGLAQNSVYCLLQDSKGFLWLGTGHGLSRFDGYQFVNYRRDFMDHHSLPDNRINSIIETKSGDLWIGTRNGLNRYDYVTNQFETFKFAAGNPRAMGDSWVQAVYEDRQGTLWVGARAFGLSKFDQATGRFTTFRNDPGNLESLSHNDVFAMTEDQEGRFWIATSGGLNKFDRETGRFKRYQADPKNPNSLSDNRINAMLLDRAGMIWLGTESGLNKFDPQANKFTRYTTDKNGLSDNAIRALGETKSGVLWVGTRNGLNRYVKETDNFVVYQHDPAIPRSLSAKEVLSIIEDNLQQLWVGTTDGGLNKYNQKKARFRQFKHDARNPNSISNDNVVPILEDKNNIVWLAPVGGGLIRYYPMQQRFEDFKGFTDQVNSLYEDRIGRIWIGAVQGLLYFDPDTKRLLPFGNNSNEASLKNVFAMREDRAGNLWIGTISGELSKLERASGKVTRVQFNSKNIDALANKRILAILEDRFGQMWIGTRNLLSQLNPTTGKFTEYVYEPNNEKSLSASTVGAIYEDKSGTLWFGTSSGGLERFDRATQTFTHFTEREGLPINNVYEILEDEQGNLWLSTDNGLARFNIATGRFRNFDVNDGLTYNEFNDRAAFKNKNGEMYFGGPRGFVLFNPKDFVDSQFRPPIFLTDIRVLEQPFKTAQNITQLKEVNLSWRDYVVSFDFAALDFTDPKKLQYQWKLEGFDQDWINGGTRRTATYTNLPGGDYVLKVKATNVDGIWTPESLHLKIKVTPPFYRTIWFYALVTLALGALIGLFYRSRINQLHAINDARTQFAQQLITSQEAERKRIAAELHDGLGQSLLVIKNRTTIGKRFASNSQKVTAQLEEISQATGQALEEVRGIAYNLRPYHLERLGLRESIEAMIEKIGEVTGLTINARVALSDEVFSGDSEVLFYRVIQECLNNVIKHAQASKVDISIVQTETAVTACIQDNGCGFSAPPDQVSQQGGFGLIGLVERVRMLGGTHTIQSEAGKGTIITVTVPRDQE
jgi:ligand-binding sensor domain-containing protein/signal transduction histidine kinase